MQIDDRIKQAQRRGAGVYLLGAFFTVLAVAVVLTWLFLVRGFVLIIGPQDATPIATVSTISGNAWVSGNKVYTLGGEVQLRIQADTFKPEILTITADSPSNIEVVLAPSPAIITANLALKAGEASWYIFDELVFAGNQLSYELEEGEYVLTLMHPHYQQWTQTITAERAQEIVLTPTLELVQGSININTIPRGARVFVDQQEVGVSPLMLELGGGQYEVTTELENYQNIQDTIDISFNQPNPVRNYQLQAVQASLILSASPSDGTLLINNLEQPLGKHFLDAKARHSIRYSKAGYYPFNQSITLEPKEEKSLNIQLKPELGKLSVRSNVEAQLSINGKASGVVSNKVKVIELSAKPMLIEVTKPGYRSVTQTVTPTSKRELVLNIDLMTEFDARRKEGRPLFASQLGIALKKFRPSAYVMGSPPNETGRRRNEHQVKVDFDRDIWVSETEITQAQYAAFTGQSSTSNLPQTDVTWNDAARFANWLSEQEGLPVFYQMRGTQVVGYNPQSNGYRLPTEAEWEWLAKKADRVRSTVYVWGDQTRIPTNSGNFADESVKGNQLIFLQDYNDGKAGVAAVASFKADRIGLYDLAGNVSEWVNDFYTTALPDSDSVQMNYMGAARGTQHVVKGGNYASGRLRELRGAFREVGESAKPTIGFRIARYER